MMEVGLMDRKFFSPSIAGFMVEISCTPAVPASVTRREYNSRGPLEIDSPTVQWPHDALALKDVVVRDLIRPSETDESAHVLGRLEGRRLLILRYAQGGTDERERSHVGACISESVMARVNADCHGYKHRDSRSHLRNGH